MTIRAIGLRKKHFEFSYNFYADYISDTLFARIVYAIQSTYLKSYEYSLRIVFPYVKVSALNVPFQTFINKSHFLSKKNLIQNKYLKKGS
jgi:hypothetical protein